MQHIKKLINQTLDRLGLHLIKSDSYQHMQIPIELSSEEIELVKDVLDRKLTMVSPAGLASTLLAAKYVAENEIAGDFVECGVWRGGNSIIAAEVFRRFGMSKKIWLYDTFAGMTRPTSEDKSLGDNSFALDEYLKSERDTHNEWCFASIEEVRSNFDSRGLLRDGIHFVQGSVEETLLSEVNLPEKISILRLDTDWYESTKVELEVLYPRLVRGGVLIIDDYGYWAGSKKATDEYFSTAVSKPLFHATDQSRRVAVKL